MIQLDKQSHYICLHMIQLDKQSHYICLHMIQLDKQSHYICLHMIQLDKQSHKDIRRQFTSKVGISPPVASDNPLTAANNFSNNRLAPSNSACF